MKKIYNTIFLFHLLYIINVYNCHYQPRTIFKCEHNDYEERQPLPFNQIKLDENFKRRIEGESTPDFVDFKIDLDFANLEEDLKSYKLSSQKDFYESSMKKAVETLTALLKVRPLNIGEGNTGFNLKDKDFLTIGISYWDKEKCGDEAIKKHKTFNSQNIHLAIFAKLMDLPENTLATASARVYQNIAYEDQPGSTLGLGQPLVGVVSINKNIDYSKPNSKLYFQTILVHEFTHILGFSKYFFETYYHNIYNETDKFGIERMYLNSSKLLEVAKKYYDCNDIKGVELENQGGEGTAGSHWEARILLGEYMNGYAYTEEQVISEFTLAVLEDSGYYKPNYYTGGLMRYGKHKGCGFLTEKCINSKEVNPIYENEFYDIYDKNVTVESRCSSGRQSRTYIYLWEIEDIPDEYNYYEDILGGYEPADYCPVSINYNEEEKQHHFVGHCQKESGKYGTLIHYNTNQELSNENIKQHTGEVLTFNSFCYLSSLSTSELISKVVRANCYETFCSNKSLTIKIFNDYIVCPRAGGTIHVVGYNGYLLCPDYNLICSGTVVCNNLFDCVEKQSLAKEESYIYDYEVKTSQNYEKSLDEIDDSDNYELSEDGKCPQYCKHCQEKNICITCKDDYGKKLEDDKSVRCYPLEEFEEGYFTDNNDVHVKCIDNCSFCQNTKSCGKCAEGFFYSKNKCVEIPSNIKTL